METVGDALSYGYFYVYSFLVAVAGMVDPSAEDYACTLRLFLQFLVQFVFAYDLDDPFLRVGGEMFQIIFGGFELLVFLFLNNDVGFEVLGDADCHFLLSDGVHGDVDAGVDVEVEQVGDVLDGHGEGLVPGGEVEFLFEEGVIEVEDVDVFGAVCEILVQLLWRVKFGIVLKHRSLESDIARVEDSSDVGLDQDHGRPRHVVGVEEGEGHFQIG